MLLCGLALAASGGVAQGAVEVNERQRFVLNETTCTGELVSLDVTVHFVRRQTEPSNGGLISGSHLNSVSGIATSASGARYVFRDGSNSHSTNPFLPDPVAAQTSTSTIRLRLMRTGKAAAADDLVFRAVFHFTADANGDVKVEFARSSGFECR